MKGDNGMMKKNKRGDTLIEVTIAVGIFSMVAVAVMAVMNGGAASAQTMLEATLAREEVDAQAEALRFIQSSYIAEKSNGNDNDGTYSILWKDIIEHSREGGEEVENYDPGNCNDLYGENGEANNGFVINTRALGLSNAGNVLVGVDKIKPAVTYPRLVYDNDDGKLVGNNDATELRTELSSAEGIYIVAVKDIEKTKIGDEKKSAFYDFYIRTCWYGSGESAASTLYTLIRLGDPDVGNSGS